MNCPNNTYYSCNSCCSGIECTCKKTTTTTSTTTINVPCDVNNCEQVIDLQCVVHYGESECLATSNSDLQSLIGTIFEKITGYNCSCDFCGAVVEKVLIPSTTTTTTSNITTTTSTSTTTTTTIPPCYCYKLTASDEIDGGYYSYIDCEGVQLNNQYIDQNEELFICARLNTVFTSRPEITVETQQVICSENVDCQPTTTTTTSTSTSTTSTTTIIDSICFCIHVEGIGCGLQIQLPIGGNALPENGRPVYNFITFGVFGYVYYDGVQWMYKNIEEGFMQPLNNSNFFPYGTFSEWGSIDITKYMNSSTLGVCSNTTTTTSSSTTTTTTTTPCSDSCFKIENTGLLLAGYTLTGCSGITLPFLIEGNTTLYQCAVSAVSLDENLIITNLGDCSVCNQFTTTTSTSSTTSTTTINIPTCECYTLENSVGSPLTYSYTECNGSIQNNINLNGFDAINICAIVGTVTANPGIVITPNNTPCIDNIECSI